MLSPKNIISKKGWKTTVLGFILILAGVAYFLAPIIKTDVQPNNVGMIIVFALGGVFLLAPDKFMSVLRSYFRKIPPHNHDS